MKALLNKVITALPYPLRLAALYTKYRATLGARARRRAREYGFTLLERSHVQGAKHSDTLFVLGSGASINQIPAERWDVISEHDSIGLNFWLFHSFVPTLYYFEVAEDHEAAILQRFQRAASDAAPRYREVVKIVSELHNGDVQLRELAPAFRSDLYAHYAMPLFAETEAQLSLNARLLTRAGHLDPHGSLHTLVKHAGSLSTVLDLAAKMGYRRIVLCGVDLTSPAYFYQDAARYPQVGNFQSSIATAQHESVVAGLYPQAMPADAVVKVLLRELLVPLGIELFVENASSALHPMVPVAPASLWAHPHVERGIA